MTEPTKTEIFAMLYGHYGTNKTIFNDELIRSKMEQNILPQLQGKTLSFNFGAINEVMEALKDWYDIPLKRTIRQQRIQSFNNWIRYTKTTTVTPFDSFEEEIMKGRVIIERASNV